MDSALFWHPQNVTLFGVFLVNGVFLDHARRLLTIGCMPVASRGTCTKSTSGAGVRSSNMPSVPV